MSTFIFTNISLTSIFIQFNPFAGLLSEAGFYSTQRGFILPTLALGLFEDHNVMISIIFEFLTI